LKRIWKQLAGLTVIALSASPCFAQSSDWEFDTSIYLFSPETVIGIGGLESELSFKDALENLDFAFMGSFGASNGKWSFLADYLLTDLSFGSDTPHSGFSGVNTALKSEIFNGYAAYRVYQDPKVNVDLAAGFRWFRTKSDVTLLPGTLPGGTTSVSESWTDPVIGIRTHFDISEKWSGTVFADYGGFSSDSETWQILLTADYKINEKWSARVGYRQISIDHDIDGAEFSFDQSGPIFGATYRF
jgi:hypothetical protein